MEEGGGGERTVEVGGCRKVMRGGWWEGRIRSGGEGGRAGWAKGQVGSLSRGESFVAVGLEGGSGWAAGGEDSVVERGWDAKECLFVAAGGGAVLHVRLPTRVASRDWWATSPASDQAAILLVRGLHDLLDWKYS